MPSIRNLVARVPGARRLKTMVAGPVPAKPAARPIPSGPLNDYSVFFARFGGAARVKHTVPGKRPFALPPVTDLPRKFIRLCPWEMDYLFCVARRARAGILEIGRFYGGSTFLLACANPNVPIWSIDIAPKDDAFLRDRLLAVGVGRNVNLIVGDSRTVNPSVGSFDLLFIDGDHSYEGCSADIAAWYPKLAPNGHMVFHDSYLGGEGVQDAIMDFMKTADVHVIQSPYIGATFWNYPAGSIAHLIKR